MVLLLNMPFLDCFNIPVPSRACLIVDVTFDQTGYKITFTSFVLGCPTFWLTTAY